MIEEPEPRRLRIATWNLHFGGEGGSPVHWSRLLQETNADVLLFQESAAPEQYVGGLDPAHSTWEEVNDFGWGSAIYSALAIRSRIELPGFRGSVVGGCVERRGLGEFAVFSVHVPTIGGQRYAKTLHRILDEITALDLRLPLVVGGDFNLVSVGLRQREEAFKTRRFERDLLQRLSEMGLRSAWQAAHPGEPLAQTLRWTRDRSAPYHADALFVPREWSVEHAEVLCGAEWSGLSDHNPVVATLGIPPTQAARRPPVPAEARPATLERALEIAARAHAGAVDKAGAPYILHPIRVMLAVDSMEERIAAVLHDVVEDSPLTLQDLRAEGFEDRIVTALDALTRRTCEGYLAFCARAGADPIARKVKLADLRDNLDPTRIASPGASDLKRMDRYRAALRLLAEPDPG